MDRQVRQLALVQVDPARVRRDQSHDHVKASGLACPVRTKQAHHLDARDFERHAFDDGARLEALGEALRVQDAHFAGGFGTGEAASGLVLGWMTTVTRPSGEFGAAPLAALTEKKSERWSMKMYSPFTTSLSRVTRACSKSSTRSLRSSSSILRASPSVQTPSLPSLGSPFWRKRTGLPVAVANWKPSASWRTTMRSARTTCVPLVSTTLPSKMLRRRVSSELILFASMCVGLSLSDFSAFAGAARTRRARTRNNLIASPPAPGASARSGRARARAGTAPSSRCDIPFRGPKARGRPP